MDMLKISHISKKFAEKQVLQDVDFTVPEHAVYGFVGQNGAGKTTTMKLALGLLPADQGEICQWAESFFWRKPCKPLYRIFARCARVLSVYDSFRISAFLRCSYGNG